MHGHDAPLLLCTRSEVARAYRVSPATVDRWRRQGRLQWVTTLGGHHRYRVAPPSLETSEGRPTPLTKTEVAVLDRCPLD